ncbi:hypothetical protein [Vitiosangium sp. GDMCC 1.1324]|uniref:beta strand repeat-containing protein n=1 Tax=Vitiosangium sp. (strain GDMCC 1.1324) TaxID=2138576 RepID=UPI000D35843F|nr:hypothetical protein [Vitiosangium sp. GDMCC 1.1324]PTL77304.1 hypothetical protein DAT35_45585 [Vitiosangium sp. GDMCC 1.1324]
MRLQFADLRACSLVLVLLSCSPPPRDDGNPVAASAFGSASASLTSPEPQLLASATFAPSDGLAFVTITVTPRDSTGAPLGPGLHVEVLSSDGLVTLGGTGTTACTVNAPSATCLKAVDSGAGSYVVTAKSSTALAVPTTFSATVTGASGTETLPDTADVTFDSSRFEGGAGCAGTCGTTITTGNVTITSSNAEGRNLYITGGTVTFDATTEGQTFGDVFITGGTVTHLQATNAAMYKLDILTGSWNLLGGTVNTTSKGYGMTCFSNGSCSGNGLVSFGPNGAPSSVLSGTSQLYGASHGGMGSGNYRINMTAASNSHAGNAGTTYGDYRDPKYPGATNSTYSGFHGGGVARITSAGTCVLAGTASITASSPSNGAGGSINLRCRGITSTGWTGSINADGGPGAGNSSIPVGAGGGGRIALVSTGDAATITGAVSYPPTNLTAQVHAFGGAPANSSYVIGAGGAGTIYLKHSGLTYGDLLIANNSPAHYQNEGTTRLPAIAGTLTANVTAGATQLPVSIASTSFNATYYENAGAPLNTNPALTQNTTPSSSAAYNGVFAGGWLRPDISAAGGALFDPLNLVSVTTNAVGSLTTTAVPSDIAAGSFFRSVEVLDHLDVLGNAILETNGDIYVLSGNTTSSGASTMTVNGLVLFDTTSNRTGRIQYAGGAVNVVQSTQAMPSVGGGTLVADNVSVTAGALTVPTIVASNDVTVSGGTLTTNSLTAARYAQTAGVLKHYPPIFKTSPAAAMVYGLQLTIADTFTLTGGSMDVAGLGYPMACDPQGAPLTAWGFGATGPLAATGVANGYGAGHGGVGGGYTAGAVRGMAYDDYRDPRYPGGAAASVGGSPSYLSYRSNGGGVFRLDASGTCTLGGSTLIKAGVGTTGAYGAAGGSVSMRCGGFDTTGWNGSITANGANAYSGSLGAVRAGGGGRIALVSTGGVSSFVGALSYPLPTGNAQLQARGGTGLNATYTDGGAGTVFLKHADVAYGQLLINNNNQTHYPAGGYTPFISIAGTVSSAVSAGDTTMGVTITSTPLHGSAAFNQRLSGMWLRPDTSVNSGNLPADNLVTVSGNTFVSSTLTQLTISPALAAVPAGASFKSADLFDVYNVVGGAITQTNGDIYIAP